MLGTSLSLPVFAWIKPSFLSMLRHFTVELASLSLTLYPHPSSSSDLLRIVILFHFPLIEVLLWFFDFSSTCSLVTEVAITVHIDQLC